jgi:hypothetical protein
MKTFFLACALALLSACSHLSVTRGLPGGGGERSVGDIKLESFVLGTVTATKIYEHEVCPRSHISRLHLKMSGGDVGLAIVTLGIYTPQHIEIWCAAN